jgi:hypothetical protein
MTNHITSTFLLSGFIYPFLVITWPFLGGEKIIALGPNLFIALLMGWMASLAWIFPALFIGKFLIGKALSIKAAIKTKFFVWLMLEAKMIIGIGLLLAFVLGTDVTRQYLFFLLQIIVALWIASAIRYNYFLKLVKQNAG